MNFSGTVRELDSYLKITTPHVLTYIQWVCCWAFTDIFLKCSLAFWILNFCCCIHGYWRRKTINSKVNNIVGHRDTLVRALDPMVIRSWVQTQPTAHCAAGLLLGTKGKGSFEPFKSIKYYSKGVHPNFKESNSHVTVTVIPMGFLQVSQNSSSLWVMIRLMNQDHPSESFLFCLFDVCLTFNTTNTRQYIIHLSCILVYLSWK